MLLQLKGIKTEHKKSIFFYIPNPTLTWMRVNKIAKWIENHDEILCSDTEYD